MSPRRFTLRYRPEHRPADGHGDGNGDGRNDGGAILPLAAVGMVVAILAAALAVDLGRMAQDKRSDQRVADLAALDGVRALPTSVAALPPALTSTQLGDVVKLSAQRNKFSYGSPNSIDAVCGLVDSTGHNFAAVPTVAGVPVPCTSVNANAVQVTVTSQLKNAFVPGQNTLRATATATLGNSTGCFGPTCVVSDGNPLGTVRVGSKFASLNGSEPTIFNRLLSQVVGGTYNLDLAGYQGLAAGNVRFDKLRTALGLTAGSPDSALDSSLSFRSLLDATVNALNADGTPSSATAATKLATIATQVSAAAGLHMTLRRFFDIVGNVGGGNDVAGASINVLDVLRGGMALADTDHFAQFDLLAASNDLPALQALLPNFVSARVKFGLIEAPQMKSGAPKTGSTYNTVATSSQVRLEVDVTFQLNVAGVGVFNVTVPYYVDGGSAQAKLDTLHCSGSNTLPDSVDILGVTQAASANIGSVSNPALSDTTTAPVPGVATLTNVSVTPLIHVTVTTTSVVTTSVAGTSKLLTFSPAPYAASDASKSVPGTQLVSLPVLAAGNVSSQVSVTTPAVFPLPAVTVVDATLSSNVAASVVTAVSTAKLPLLDNIFTPLMKSLGLSLAGAEVWAPPPQLCQPSSYSLATTPSTSIGPALVG